MFQQIANSIVLRITLISVVLIILTFVCVGAGVLWFLGHSVERSLDNHLEVFTDILASSVRVEGDEVLLNTDNETLKLIPRHWQVSSGNNNYYRSERLKGWIPLAPSDSSRIFYTDKDGINIIALQRTYFFPTGGDDKTIPITLIFGLDADIAEAYKKQEMLYLRATIYKILVPAALLLSLVAYFTTRYAISPFLRIKDALNDVREGKATKVVGNFPGEITQLTEEINSLIEYGTGVVERHRDFSGNLAHALKTPLTVIKNETDIEVIREKVGIMLNIIDRNLARAQTVGPSNVLFGRTQVLPIIEDIIEGYSRVYDVEVELSCSDDLYFRGDKADLYEVLGNIIENAYKYAHSIVKMSTQNGQIIVEDDGPGVPKDKMQDILDRGNRLDKLKPGTGIGLAVARDVVRLYQGDIILEKSALSGLKVLIDLPISS